MALERVFSSTETAIYQAKGIGDVPLAIRALPGQTANLLEFRNSSNVVVSAVGPTGPFIDGSGNPLGTGLAFNAVDYGFVPGASSAALRAALAAVVAALPAVGGWVYLPAGTYALGSLAVAAGLTIARGNVTLRGAGMGQTILTYDSARSSATLGPGTCVLVGNDVTTYQNITVSDMTIIDLNTVNQEITGHNPSAIEVFRVDNLRIERVEVVNAKGNSGINIVGTVSANVPQNIDARVIDCVIRGTSAGNWIEGDGLNIGAYQSVYVLRNRIEGVKRNGIEGGLNWGVWIEENDIDMMAQGLNAIGTASFIYANVSRNIVRNIIGSGSRALLGVIQDSAAHPVGSLFLTNNTLLSDDPSAGSLLIWQPNGGVSIGRGPVTISGNHAQSRSPIQVYYNPVQFKVFGNTWDLMGAIGPVIGAVVAYPSLGADEFFEANDERVFNDGGSAKYLANLTTYPEWKSARVRCRNVGRDGSPWVTGQADGGWSSDTVDLASIANGASSPERTVTHLGALVGDKVEVRASAALPSGTFLVGDVSAADTIAWRLVNVSGGAADPGSLTYYVRVLR